jgi:hypothetical protein
MGMLCPNFNTTGALWGSFVSLTITGAIVIGAQVNIYQGNLKYPTLPFNVESCLNYNETSENSTLYVADADSMSASVPWIFRINYMYYSLIGSIIFTIVGYPISLLTGGTRSLDERLISPIARRFFRKKLLKSVAVKDGELENLNTIK